MRNPFDVDYFSPEELQGEEVGSCPVPSDFNSENSFDALLAEDAGPAQRVQLPAGPAPLPGPRGVSPCPALPVSCRFATGESAIIVGEASIAKNAIILKRSAWPCSG